MYIIVLSLKTLHLAEPKPLYFYVKPFDAAGKKMQ